MQHIRTNHRDSILLWRIHILLALWFQLLAWLPQRVVSQIIIIMTREEKIEA